MITAERLRELLAYDPMTGTFQWLVSRRGRCARIGVPAGGARRDGYWRIKVDGERYFAHRLAWFYTHGRWPIDQIDHINGNPSDNRLENLREATVSQNIGNSKRPARNTTGYKGVTFNRRQQKWIANIGHNYRCIHLGAFGSPQEAHAAYDRAARRLYGEFARLE